MPAKKIYTTGPAIGPLDVMTHDLSVLVPNGDLFAFVLKKYAWQTTNPAKFSNIQNINVGSLVFGSGHVPSPVLIGGMAVTIDSPTTRSCLFFR